MRKNIIIFVLIGIIAILGGFLVFNKIQTKSLLPPRLLISEEEWDFGKVKPGEKPTHIFTIKNGGEEELIIEEIKKSRPCIEASISTTPTRLQPGESAELKVTYDTTDYVGKDGEHIHIISNDPQVPDKWIDLYVEIEAFQIPYLQD